MATAVPVDDVHAHRDVRLSLTEVNALFDTRTRADQAAAALRQSRFHVEDVAVWDARDHEFWAVDERLGRDLRWAGADALLAGAVGAVVMALVTMLVGYERMGVGTSMVLGTLLGLGFGGLLGAMFGLQMADPPDDDPLISMTGTPGAYTLTFVTARPTRARRLVRSYGAQLVSEPGHNLPVTK